MELDVYNPLKGRNETIRAEFTALNTTCFEKAEHDGEIEYITDTDDGLLIREFGYRKPILIAVESRKSINYSQQGALDAIAEYCLP